MDLVEKKIKIGEIDPRSLFGVNDVHLTFIESRFDSSITFRNNNIVLRGELAEVKKLESVFEEMIYVLKKKHILLLSDVATILDTLSGSPIHHTQSAVPIPFTTNTTTQQNDNVVLWGRKEPIKAKTPTQIEYVQKVRVNDIVFAVGPAGTGKTYLAVAMALAALRNGDVSKIVLSRPAVEAGESLGYLPGDLFEKVDPYLRPLLDAVSDMVTPDKLKSLNDKNIIEISPLAYMRGRTLNNSFIILDEAQNTSPTQMKMFLTRLGQGSKAIVTGDITQIDLSSSSQSGLVDVQRVLDGVQGIEFVTFDKKDVVRHKLVADIISAYERDAEINQHRK